MIEIDAHILPGGEIILLHDKRLERTTNGHGSVYEIDFATLRTLNAGRGEIIPTLHEAIECVQRKVPLNIELKNRGSGSAVASVLRKYLAKGWKPDDFLISSFDHHEINAFKKDLPHVPVSALIYSIPLDYAACCEVLDAQVISPAADLVTPEFVTDAHARGLRLFSWIWEPVADEQIQELCSMGVDGIFSDYPDITRGIIRANPSALRRLPGNDQVCP